MTGPKYGKWLLIVTQTKKPSRPPLFSMMWVNTYTTYKNVGLIPDSEVTFINHINEKRKLRRIRRISRNFSLCPVPANMYSRRMRRTKYKYVGSRVTALSVQYHCHPSFTCPPLDYHFYSEGISHHRRGRRVAYYPGEADWV